MRNGLERIRKLTSSSSPWVEKIKTEKIWLCESVGKLKGIGKQGEVKMHEIGKNKEAYFVFVTMGQKN